MLVSSTPGLISYLRARELGLKKVFEKKKDSQNIYQNFQTDKFPSQYHSHQFSCRKLYQGLCPNYDVHDVEYPHIYVNRFTPDGRLLICFTSDLVVVQVYKYLGSPSSELSEEMEKKFSQYFQLHYQKAIVNESQHSLSKDFCLITSCQNYMILASFSHCQNDSDQLEPNQSSNQTYDSGRFNSHNFHETFVDLKECLYDYIFYLVEVKTGLVTDRYCIRSDVLRIGDHYSVSFLNNRFGLVSLISQNLILFHINNGHFGEPQILGQSCSDVSPISFHIKSSSSPSSSSPLSPPSSSSSSSSQNDVRIQFSPNTFTENSTLNNQSNNLILNSTTPKTIPTTTTNSSLISDQQKNINYGETNKYNSSKKEEEHLRFEKMSDREKERERKKRRILTVNGLKHKMMCYLFHKNVSYIGDIQKEDDNNNNRTTISTIYGESMDVQHQQKQQQQHNNNHQNHYNYHHFHYYFYDYSSLILIKFQFLSECNLILLKYVHADSFYSVFDIHKNNYFVFVVYNIEKSCIVSMFDNTSREFLSAYENLCSFFQQTAYQDGCSLLKINYNSLIEEKPSLQYQSTLVLPNSSNNLDLRDILRKNKSKINDESVLDRSHARQTRNIKQTLSNLPLSPQSISCSPYLDQSIFIYDDGILSERYYYHNNQHNTKIYSNGTKIRLSDEYPVRFFDRSTGRVCWRLYLSSRSRDRYYSDSYYSQGSSDIQDTETDHDQNLVIRYNRIGSRTGAFLLDQQSQTLTNENFSSKITPHPINNETESLYQTHISSPNNTSSKRRKRILHTLFHPYDPFVLIFQSNSCHRFSHSHSLSLHFRK